MRRCWAGIVVAMAMGAGWTSGAVAAPPADVEARIDALIGQMTVEEKLGQLQMLGTDEVGALSDSKAQQAVREGRVGSLLSARGAAHINAAQRIAVEQSRLKIPLIFGLDVIHGYRTTFPIPLGEAASWDPAGAERAAHVAAAEAHAAGVNWTFAPMVDISRDARWGRVAEGAGEDPFLGAAFASARVRGFQGDDPAASDRLVATAKHWVAYGGAEAGREYNTVDVSRRMLRERYFPPFQAALDAGVGTFMTSFNDIAGVPGSANHWTLTDVLRGEWGFTGPVVSDYTAVAELRSCPVVDRPDRGNKACGHGVAATGADAAALALNAGTDIEMISELYGAYGPQLVRDGRIPMVVLDEAVRRVLRLKFQAGLFDHPYVDPAREPSALLTAANRREARRSVARSMVLLRNRGGVLPLRPAQKRVAVIGPLADARADLLGTWSIASRPQDVTTVSEGLRAAGKQVVSVAGCTTYCRKDVGFAAAAAAARSADAAVVVVGEPAALSGEASARTKLGLPGRQEALVRRVLRTGTPTAVVVVSGRPLVLNGLARSAQALLWSGHPGTEAGGGFADVLTGAVNPGGKLPMSFPRSVGQLPMAYNEPSTGRPRDPDNKYTSKYLDQVNAPLFAFGYGRSYTSFAIDDVRPSAGTVSPTGTLTVSARVRNTGARTGDEVVQLYLHDRAASVVRPLRQLAGFQRVTLRPGQERTVTFTLGPSQLGLWNADEHFVVEPGVFDVWVGDSSNVAQVPARASAQHASFAVVG